MFNNSLIKKRQTTMRQMDVQADPNKKTNMSPDLNLGNIKKKPCADPVIFSRERGGGVKRLFEFAGGGGAFLG